VIFALGYLVGPLLGAAASAVLPFLGATIIAAGIVVVVTWWAARALPRTKPRPEALAPRPRGRAASRW